MAAAFEVLRDKGSWDFGIWCPRQGPGRDGCGPGYGRVRKGENTRPYHRYLIEATALYVDLTSDGRVRRGPPPAAQEAVRVCGPAEH